MLLKTDAQINTYFDFFPALSSGFLTLSLTFPTKTLQLPVTPWEGAIMAIIALRIHFRMYYNKYSVECPFYYCYYYLSPLLQLHSSSRQQQQLRKRRENLKMHFGFRRVLCSLGQRSFPDETRNILENVSLITHNYLSIYHCKNPRLVFAWSDKKFLVGPQVGLTRF